MSNNQTLQFEPVHIDSNFAKLIMSMPKGVVIDDKITTQLNVLTAINYDSLKGYVLKEYSLEFGRIVRFTFEKAFMLDEPATESTKGQPMTHTHEQKQAIKEGYRIAASDEYFAARKMIDTEASRKLFEAGFDRGYEERETARIDGLGLGVVVKKSIDDHQPAFTPNQSVVDGIAALRQLRLWHWRRVLKYRKKEERQKNKDTEFGAEIARQTRNKANESMKFVQVLNDYFPADDTAENDYEAAKLNNPKGKL